MARPIPKPAPYDPEAEMNKLLELKRFFINLNLIIG
jgi:hypothetical protein